MNQASLDSQAPAKVLPLSSGYTKERPCPVCHGYRRGVSPFKCTGRLEGDTALCSATFRAGALPCEEGLFAHTLGGRCACDKRHEAPQPLDESREQAPPRMLPTTSLGLENAIAMAVRRPMPVLLVPDMGIMAGAGVPHMFAGEPSSGKTIVLQALVLALLRGETSWAGFKLGKLERGRIVHVDYEVGEVLLDRRYQRLATGMGFELRDLGDRLQRVSFPPYRLVPEHRDVWRRLMAGADFMIVDSLGSAAGFSLNAREFVTDMMGMLAELSRETGCRVVLIHHLRKTTLSNGRHPDPERALEAFPNELCGSGALLANLDAGLGCIGREGEPIFVGQFRARSVGLNVPSFTLKVVDVDHKGNSVVRDPRHPSPGLRLDRGPAEAFLAQRQAWKSAAQAQEAALRRERDERRVEAALPAHDAEGLSMLDLAASVEVTEKRVRRALLALRLAGTLERYEDRAGAEGRPRTLFRRLPPPPV